MELITDEGNHELKVLSCLITGVNAPLYGEAIATVADYYGNIATVRAVTSEGRTWHVVPGSKETGSYAGLRDAQRHMYQRSGLDNNTPVITVASAEPVLHHAYPG